jgi:phage repressor protein C with HTH and peptisase S24 domain
MEKTVIELIKEVLDEKGLSPEEAARLCGLERSYFRKLFDRGTSSPRGVTLQKIASGLGIEPSRLLGQPQAQSQITTDIRPAEAEVPSRLSMPNDVPVMGTAAGSHLRGAFQFSMDPIDYVRRPPALMGARDIYALYVEGESMVPQYSPGDLIYVHSHKPPRFGDAVVIQCHNGSDQSVEATIGIFARRTAEKIVIRKHNPIAEVEISRSGILHIHKILTTNELFGV